MSRGLSDEARSVLDHEIIRARDRAEKALRAVREAVEGLELGTSPLSGRVTTLATRVGEVQSAVSALEALQSYAEQV